MTEDEMNQCLRIIIDGQRSVIEAQRKFLEDLADILKRMVAVHD